MNEIKTDLFPDRLRAGKKDRKGNGEGKKEERLVAENKLSDQGSEKEKL